MNTMLGDAPFNPLSTIYNVCLCRLVISMTNVYKWLFPAIHKLLSFTCTMVFM